MASQQPPARTGGISGAVGTLNPVPEIPTNQTTQATTHPADGATKKKKKTRRKKGKGKGDRRQSFAIPDADAPTQAASSALDTTSSARELPFFKLGRVGTGDLSDTSLDSEALLDHRDHPPMRARRDSRAAFQPPDLSQSFRPHVASSGSGTFSRKTRTRTFGHDSSDDERPSDTRTPLLGPRNGQQSSPKHGFGYGILKPGSRDKDYMKSHSRGSSVSGSRSRLGTSRDDTGYDVNNPPSVPTSPKVGPDTGPDDVMLTDPFSPVLLERRKSAPTEQLIDIDGDAEESALGSNPETPKAEETLLRRHTLANPAEGDVCFPVEGMSEMAEEDYAGDVPPQYRQRRRRIREWPDLSVLEEWSREELEERSEGIRAKKISEPVLVEGRLRPIKKSWRREEEDAPYRFTYFNEEFQSTIHSQTISELLQPGQTFRDLFIPDPPELSDESSDDEEVSSHMTQENRSILSPAVESRAGTRHSSIIGVERNGNAVDSSLRGPATASPQPGQLPTTSAFEKPKRYGNRPTFWLDVLCPTETEMRVIAKAFGIHPLTAEDILVQEAREKVELFRNYYFVNYRTFEQDVNSEDYLEPVNMYVVVFREGVLSFHFSLTPHPANVRRRIRQLKDYLILTADWISYAIIDDITDVYAPLIQSIEEEVDKIDDAILQLHTDDNETSNNKNNKKSSNEKDAEKRSETEETVVESSGDMLRRVGQARKKVMSLFRLLGNKADVIKGFAKRCNEQWDVAPRSEIGLYLGDIQDHVLTMTNSLNHYETILSRAHSNYLTQLNIRQAERAEYTNDVLGKLTVLGTIVLPMNIVTGLFGSNFRVPGEGGDNLNWFYGTTVGLLIFGLLCYFVARRAYGIL